MKVHHLNCGTFCPLAGQLVAPGGKLVCHCLLVESTDGLVLVDSGFGRRDVENVRDIHPLMRWAARPRLALAETAADQIEALGYSLSDVRHVVVTHLDLDHAGGLADFPQASVHVMSAEKRDALAPSNALMRRRYIASQFAHAPKFRTYDVADGEPWFGFSAVREVVPGNDIFLIPLPGHTNGHAAVAVREGGGWLLHAGDAYFQSATIRSVHNGNKVPVSPVMRVFERAVAMDYSLVKKNHRRLADLAAKEASVRIFSAHDPSEFLAHHNQA